MAGRGKGKAAVNQRNAAAVVVIPAPIIKKRKAPAHAISNMFEIEKYFNASILDQPTSIRNLSVTLSTLLNKTGPMMENNEAFAPQMITFAGPSGTGKTATVECLRLFLGMDEGAEFENLFIEFDASSGSNNTQQSNNNDDCQHQKDSHDLLSRLSQAVESFGLSPPPPYLVLFVDNYELASQSSRLLINRLLGNGKCRTTEGSQFVLPGQTALLIVCTCLFGADDIINMEERCDYVAKRFISRAMEKYVTSAQCKNLLLPYYPLDDEILKQLLVRKLDSYIGSARLLKRFGVEVLTSTPKMKDTLIGHVLSKLDKRYGMHDGERILRDKLDLLIETGMAVIEGQMRDKERAPILLDSFTFDTRAFGEILEKELDSLNCEVIRTIKDNPENKQYLAKCDSKQNGIVETVSMQCGGRPVCGLIMDVTYVNINNYYDTNETTKLLKDNNKQLKACIKSINDVVERKGSHNMIDDIIKNYHDLLHESSDDSNNEDSAGHTQQQNKRKQQVLAIKDASRRKKAKITHNDTPSTSTTTSSSSSEEEETETSSSEDEETKDARIEMELDKFFSDDEEMFSSSEVSFTDVFFSDDEWEHVPPKPKKRGRPPRTVPGFKRVQNGQKSAYYQCHTCNKTFSKIKYTQIHKC